MLPEPLHPAIVHFPMVLVVLLPVVALVTLWTIRRGAVASRAWLVPVAVAGALTLTSWLAVRTGEGEEDRVEAVVSERAIHEHEEAAERFLVLSGVLLLVTGVGLLHNTVGASARLLATVGAFGLVLAGIQVGGAGGELVYRHGAASAYIQGGDAAVDGALRPGEDPGEH